MRLSFDEIIDIDSYCTFISEHNLHPASLHKAKGDALRAQQLMVHLQTIADFVDYQHDRYYMAPFGENLRRCEAVEAALFEGIQLRHTCLTALAGKSALPEDNPVWLAIAWHAKLIQSMQVEAASMQYTPLKQSYGMIQYTDQCRKNQHGLFQLAALTMGIVVGAVCAAAGMPALLAQLAFVPLYVPAGLILLGAILGGALAYVAANVITGQYQDYHVAHCAEKPEVQQLVDRQHVFSMARQLTNDISTDKPSLFHEKKPRAADLISVSNIFCNQTREQVSHAGFAYQQFDQSVKRSC